MATIKIPSMMMPTKNAGGYTLGGNMWVSTSFKQSDASTWDGICIDPDGKYLGASHIGITCWEDGVKRIQIRSDAMLVYGGASAWVPVGYDVGNPATWNGVVINGDGIAAFHGSSTPTFVLESATGDLTIGSVPGSQIIYDASTGTLTVPSVETQFIDTALMVVGSLSTSSGILIDVNGIKGYENAHKTFDISATTGSFTFGRDTGKQIIFDAVAGTFNIGGSFVGTVATYLSTSQLAAGAPPATGVVIDNAGIRAYRSSVKTFDLDTYGMLTLGTVSGNLLIYNSTNGSLAIGGLVSGTGVVFNQFGIQGYKSNVKTFDLDTSGNLTLGSATGNQLIYNSTSGYLAIGALVAGTGVVFNQSGISGYKSSVKTFEINTSGDAYFAGNISGSTIPSSGNLTIGTTGTPGKLVFTDVGQIYGSAGTMNIGPPPGYGNTLSLAAWTVVSLSASAQINLTAGQIVLVGTTAITGTLSATSTLSAPTLTIGAGASSFAGSLTLGSTVNLNGQTLAHHLYPAAENTYDLGESNTSRWWRNIKTGTITLNHLYAYEGGIHLVAGSGTYLSDGFDDLALLDAIDYEYDEKGEIVKNEKGETKMDIMSYPDHCLDFAAVAKTINEEKLIEHEVTEEDAKDIISGKIKHETIDPEKLKNKICLDFGSMRGLQIGALRQLNKKTDTSITDINKKLDTFITEMNEWKNKQEANQPK